MPLYWLYRNIGIAVGVIVFFASSFWVGGKILGIRYSGDGSVYSAYVQDFLEEKGVGKWTSFSSVDLKKLGNEIFASSDKFSFVNCTRKGNILDIKLVAKTHTIDRLDKSQMQLVCDVTGIVESVRVLRGTARVCVGDTVSPQTLLIEGVGELNDKVVQTGIVGSVAVLYQQQFVYKTDMDNSEFVAEIFAEQTGGDPVEIETEKTVQEGEFIYTTTVTYRKIFTP